MMKVAIVVLFCVNLFSYGLPEYYYQIKDVKKQKEEFVKIMKPLIEEVNAEILEDKRIIESFLKEHKYLVDKGLLLKVADEKVLAIKTKYRFKDLHDTYNIRARINTIPVSLALSQAALESGWGKSRFTKIANNIFGEWTYGKDGIVPQNRELGKTHKLRIFKTLKDSIRSYAANLNRNGAYKQFRKQRLENNNSNTAFTGIKAAKTMVNYSAIKEKYPKLLASIIRSNGLFRYD